jgi:transcriptional regulator with XRE-family HTH domain
VEMATANPFLTRRLEEGWSVEEVAAAARCSASTIRLIEGNWTRVSPETGERIAAVLGINPDAWRLRWEPVPA